MPRGGSAITCLDEGLRDVAASVPARTAIGASQTVCNRNGDRLNLERQGLGRGELAELDPPHNGQATDLNVSISLRVLAPESP